MGILIDTGVFIQWERSGGNVDLKQWTALGEPAISVITQSELMVGVYRANTESRRQTRSRFVHSIVDNLRIQSILG